MSKRTLVIFGIFVAIFGVLLPVLGDQQGGRRGRVARAASPPATRRRRSSSSRTAARATRSHAPAPTASSGPNLDELLGQGTPEANVTRVQNAIENGFNTEDFNGYMPAGIVQGEDAEEVADFVARVAGQ